MRAPFPEAGREITRRRCSAVVMVATWCAMLASSGWAADSQEVREAQLKAAYLFNFVKFVEWPESTPAILTICFRGAPDVRELMTAGIESKRVGKRSIAVLPLVETSDASNCNVIYVAFHEAAGNRGSPLPANQAVLTISDGKGFAKRDGIIELFTESNRLRFSVNLANADRAGLKISSTLLQLATVITR